MLYLKSQKLTSFLKKICKNTEIFKEPIVESELTIMDCVSSNQITKYN